MHGRDEVVTHAEAQSLSHVLHPEAEMPLGSRTSLATLATRQEHWSQRTFFQESSALRNG